MYPIILENFQVVKAEFGNFQIILIDRVVLVAKSLNTTVSYLIGETDIKNPASETEAGVDHTIQEWKDLLSTFSKEGLKSIIDMATAELIRRD